MSTALSDAWLALVTLVGVAALARAGGRPCSLAALGLGLVAAAAAVGSARFAGAEAVAPLHDGLSRIAGMVGLPLVGAGYGAAAWSRPTRGAPVVLVVVVGLLGGALLLGGLPGYRLAVAGAGMAVVIAVSGTALRRRHQPTAAALGIGGAAATILAGLVIGTDGVWLGVPRIDLFHLVLSGANLALALGLVVLTPMPAPLRTRPTPHRP